MATKLGGNEILEATRAIRDEVKELVRREIQSEVAVAVERSVAGRLKEILDKVSADLARSEESHGKALQAMLTAIKSLPVPVVNLPEVKPPTVNVAAPAVSVNVPRQEAPTVNVQVPRQETPNVTVNVPEGKAPTVTVNVPEQAAPTVNVTVPEQAPPTVTVNAPEPKLTKKFITYDGKGRPVEITETDMLI